jgi:hypothetical protein
MTVQCIVVHDSGYQKIWRFDVPEVFHFDRAQATKLTAAWQKLIMALNPGMTGGGFRSLLKYDRAFTNFTGFDQPGKPPRADFINHRDTNASPPVVDKARVCGGAILHGTLKGAVLTVETLNGLKPPPSLKYVLARPWLYFEAIVVKADGTNDPFPQNGGRPVYFPLVASGPITVKINTIFPARPYPLVRIFS